MNTVKPDVGQTVLAAPEGRYRGCQLEREHGGQGRLTRKAVSRAVDNGASPSMQRKKGSLGIVEAADTSRRQCICHFQISAHAAQARRQPAQQGVARRQVATSTGGSGVASLDLIA